MSYFNQNPAVIKSKMLSLDKENFILKAKEIKSILLDFELTKQNANERFALLNLYVWCCYNYRKKYIYNQK